MKLTHVVNGLAVTLLAAVLAWTFLDSGPAPHAAGEDQVAVAARKAAAGTADGARPLPAATVAAPAQAALDCAHAKGDAARSKAGAVSVADLCLEVQQLAGNQAKGDQAAQRAQARQTLERMIDRQLVAAALAAEHTAVSEPDIDAAFGQLPAAKTGPTEVPLQDVLRSQGVDVATVRRELRRRLELARLVAGHGDVEPRAAEIDQEFTDHPERYQQGGGSQVQAYIARVAPGATSETENGARQAAQAFAAAVQSAAPDTLAPAQRLPALPPFDVQPNEQEPGLVAAVTKLQPGQWTPALRTRAGWLVCKVLEHKAATARPLAEARPDIVQRLRAVKRLAEQTRILAELRAAAAIELLVAL